MQVVPQQWKGLPYQWAGALPKLMVEASHPGLASLVEENENHPSKLRYVPHSVVSYRSLSLVLLPG